MDPLIFVIFGASGDLTRRKLIPAIFELFKGDYLPEHFAVLGVSRSKLSDADFVRKAFTESGHLALDQEDPDRVRDFSQRLAYQAIDTLKETDYRLVQERLAAMDERYHTRGNYIFYLSTPPRLYDKIPGFLSTYGLNTEENGAWRRLIVEKPFGVDLESARVLNRSLLPYFDEEQIYRIDHYLGKETVQNLLVTRFANGVYEPLWNRNYIHHVEITSAENIGVGSRGGYYDQSGALRDMFQNHLMQVVALVAMEPPISPSAQAIRDEKLKLFQSLRPITEAEVSQYVIRGQYLASMILGERVLGYRDEVGVPAESKTETYCAINFFIDNWRWAGVPFYVRTAKRMPTRVTEVVISFKRPPHSLFMRENDMSNANNQLVIRIQPDEGLLLNIGMKVPGEGFRVKNVGMDFHYSDLTNAHVPTAYERLLLDGIRGDATLYARGDSVERCWEFVQPILNAWGNNPNIPVYGYPAGTWGPPPANELVQPEHLSWRNPCKNLTTDEGYCEL
ncbi:MAG: glucose-6-phosphate dehydrogenase [Bacteroidota bacterium]